MDKNKLIVNSYKLASWLCWKLPARLRYTLAAVGGEAYYWLARNHSRQADQTMRIVLGEPKINRRVRDISRRSFRNYTKYMVDFLRQPHLTNQEIIALASTTGWQYLEEAKKTGKGLMMISPHFGNWDAAAVVLLGHGHKLSSVAKDFEPPELNKLVQDARRSKGVQIYSLKDSVRGLYNALKNNEAVVLLVDSPLRNEGVVVEFFGKSVRMASGPGTLMCRTGSPAIIGYVVRQPGNDSFYGCWEPALPCPATGDRDQDIQAATQAIARAMEKVIRRHPDQWYMFRSIFLSEAEIAEHAAIQLERTNLKAARRNRSQTAPGLDSVEEPAKETV